MIVEKRNSIILILLVFYGNNILAQLPIKGQNTVTDTLISKCITMDLPGKYKRIITKYDEGIFVDYLFQDGASLTIFQGALQNTPLLLKVKGYHPQQIDTINKKIIHRGELNNKIWREDQLEGIRIYYDKVPFNKKTLYDCILNEICIRSYIPKK